MSEPDKNSFHLNSDLAQHLARIIEPSRVLTRPIELVAYASDASFYRLTPRAVVLTRGIEEVQALFRVSHQHRVPITFRAAGTSLSGQAITDGILAEVARHWRAVKVEAQGKKVRVQPGVIGMHVNRVLAAYNTKIGPDPASIGSCMMGGILANNSSGMCCGVADNAYHTLDSLTFVLPSGTVIDTASLDADNAFRQKEPILAEGLLQLRKDIHEHSSLHERISRKYRMKNTTGYALNAFIDFEQPLDIFQHLLIGSEGTLAFIAEAVLRTVPDLPIKYTGLLFFSDLYTACRAVGPLSSAGARAIELMDSASLASVQDRDAKLWFVRELSDHAAALLVEFQCANASRKMELESAARHATDNLQLLRPVNFTHDAVKQQTMWRIRKGLFPSVGATRQSGTSVILEDIVFPVECLADATLGLKALFEEHRYDNAIIFGHAKDGNLHFVISQSFSEQSEIDRYARFMNDVARLVTRYDGALKGEHGTGRNMAPFVETEWGHEAYEIMRRVKTLADPKDLLNPGVILNADRNAHIRNLKTLPPIECEVDRCIECGYCETHCPSRDLTLTPRQRIVIRREMARLEAGPAKDDESLRSILVDFQYAVIDTCAADGLCAQDCPVTIDTGTLVKRLRRNSHSERAQKLANFASKHFASMECGVRMALRCVRMLQFCAGDGFVDRLIRLSSKAIGMSFSLRTPYTPVPASTHRPSTSRTEARAVYFPSCISRMLGVLPNEPTKLPLMHAMVAVARRAEMPVFIPADVAGTCCGMPFSSKGYDQAHKIAANRAVERFWRWSEKGRLPIIIDTSPCAYGFLSCRPYLTPGNQEHFDKMQILDSVAFIYDELLSRLIPNRRLRSVALHPVCSLIKMGLTSKLLGIAQTCSARVFVPSNTGCCGFAGDRGFLFPELTKAATEQQAGEVRKESFDGYFSSSRTCEIGMSRATGQPYRSYIHLLEETTRAPVVKPTSRDL